MKKTPLNPTLYLSSGSSPRRSVPTIRLSPLPLTVTNPIRPNPVKWPPRQKLEDIYLFLTEKDSLARCSHCRKKNKRRMTITAGLRVNLKNPDHRIIFPRVSSKSWILNTPILCWLIAPQSYEQTTGWCLVEPETSCGTEGCPGNGWRKIEDRIGYRKFGRLRWECILVKAALMPKSFIIKAPLHDLH